MRSKECEGGGRSLQDATKTARIRSRWFFEGTKTPRRIVRSLPVAAIPIQIFKCMHVDNRHCSFFPRLFFQIFMCRSNRLTKQHSTKTITITNKNSQSSSSSRQPQRRIPPRFRIISFKLIALANKMDIKTRPASTIARLSALSIIWIYRNAILSTSPSSTLILSECWRKKKDGTAYSNI